MGYCTDYYLTARKVLTEERFHKLVEELKTRNIVGYALDEGWYRAKDQQAEFTCCDMVKWYDHAEDMIMVSEKFPEMTFELEGHGEEFGDFWREYYHDGECEECRGDLVFEQPRKVQWTELIRF